MTPAERLAKAKSKSPVSNRRRIVFPITPLRRLRQSLNLTQRDVGTAIGVNCATIHDAEHGCEIALTTALALAAFFGKTVEEIWKLP